MTVLSRYIKKEHELKRLTEEIEALKNDERLQEEIRFQDKLTALMEEHGKSKRDVIILLSPDEAHAPAKAGNKRVRRLKRYTNPYTHETVEARSSNHTTLKAWKEQYGKETVQGWAEDIG